MNPVPWSGSTSSRGESRLLARLRPRLQPPNLHVLVRTVQAGSAGPLTVPRTPRCGTGLTLELGVPPAESRRAGYRLHWRRLHQYQMPYREAADGKQICGVSGRRRRDTAFSRIYGNKGVLNCLSLPLFSILVTWTPAECSCLCGVRNGLQNPSGILADLYFHWCFEERIQTIYGHGFRHS